MGKNAALIIEELENDTSFASNENFADLFENTYEVQLVKEGSVVKAVVIGMEKDIVLLDVGIKSEGRVNIKEFGSQASELAMGDEIDVYIEKYEDRNGETILSREKALREAGWEKLEEKCRNEERVEGTIFGRVKGGFTVDIEGAVAFLPGSQVDIRPLKDVSALMNVPQPFMILKMDRKRGNIVVSRRAVLEESRSASRDELLNKIHEGQTLEGIVKNITDYGAFVDLGGIDGLLHVTDISWKRINHPSEAFKVGDSINVIVTKFDEKTKRVSLGMKQLEENPWSEISGKFQVGMEMDGQITNITDYGAFVELEDGIEGLVHVSEMSWTKKNVHPSKIVQPGQEVKVRVLDIEPEKHRISLGIKQCQENPWDVFSRENNVDGIIEGEVRNITDFGLFIGLTGEIDGLVHHSDISWTESGEDVAKGFSKGDMIKAKILLIDAEKERISLGIKQLEEAPEGANTASASLSTAKGKMKNKTVTCEVIAVQKDGVEVKVEGDDSNIAFIKRNDLSRDRAEQRPDRFAVGDRLDAKVVSTERKTGKLNLSIKALEIEDHNRAIEEYGSSDSGASLGDILGAALDSASKEADGDSKKAPDES